MRRAAHRSRRTASAWARRRLGVAALGLQAPLLLGRGDHRRALRLAQPRPEVGPVARVAVRAEGGQQVGGAGLAAPGRLGFARRVVVGGGGAKRLARLDLRDLGFVRGRQVGQRHVELGLGPAGLGAVRHQPLRARPGEAVDGLLLAPGVGLGLAAVAAQQVERGAGGRVGVEGGGDGRAGLGEADQQLVLHALGADGAELGGSRGLGVVAAGGAGGAQLVGDGGEVGVGLGAGLAEGLDGEVAAGAEAVEEGVHAGAGLALGGRGAAGAGAVGAGGVGGGGLAAEGRRSVGGGVHRSGLAGGEGGTVAQDRTLCQSGGGYWLGPIAGRAAEAALSCALLVGHSSGGIVRTQAVRESVNLGRRKR